MEQTTKLVDYLPLSFKTPKEQEYVAFLWDTYTSNCENQRYQFAFLADHMLTMSFVYFNIWQIKQNKPKDFGKGLIGFGKDIEKDLLEAIGFCLQHRERAQHPAAAQAHLVRQRHDRQLPNSWTTATPAPTFPGCDRRKQQEAVRGAS